MFSKSKGMLFVLDSMFAVVLLFSALAMFSLLLSTETINTQLSYSIIHFQAEDAIDVMSKLRISDARAEPVVRQLYDEGFLTDKELNKTILDVIGLLWAADTQAYTEAAGNLTDQLFANSFSPSLEWSLQAESEGVKDTIYNSTVLENISIAGASTRIASGYALGQPTKGYLARIFLSSIGSVTKSSYYYFGGFIGEGNVSVFFSGFPIDANFSSLYMEANLGENFALLVNGASCGQFNKSAGELSVDTWTVTGNCLSNLLAGQDNNVTLAFSGSNTSKQFIGGGFLKLTYTTSQLSPQLNDTMRHYFPAITGFFSTYDSFYVPGNITQMNTHAEFNSNYSTFLRVGDKNVFNVTGSELKQTVDNYSFELESTFDYSSLSEKTVPIRLGSEVPGQVSNVSNADVVLITDISGSMNWQLTNDNYGVTRGCSDPHLYDNDTRRLSLAKCLDNNFIDIILNNSGNRIALVGFSDSAYSFTSLSNDSVYLDGIVNSYSAVGGTCICCAINRAYNILQGESLPSRQKFIVVMTDGLAGYTCTATTGWTVFSSPTSSYLYGVDFANETFGYAVGYVGRIIRWNGVSWQIVSSPTSQILYGLSFASPSLAFASGSNGAIIRWTGGNWQSFSSPTGNHLFGIDMENATNGFIVGISGRILRWNGASWSNINAPTSNSLNSVAFYDVNHAFAVGASGRILGWTGSQWMVVNSPTSNTLQSVAFYNSTLGFAVGASGTIIRWDGSSWATVSSPTTNYLRGIDFSSGTRAIAVGDSGRIIEWDGTSWSIVSSPTSYGLYSVSALSDSFAFAVGIWGRIVKYYPSACQGTNTWGTYSCSGNPSDCTNPACNCAVNNAIWSSQRSYTELNATVYSVGFGPVSSCSTSNTTLYQIAQVGNGAYYASSNASGLAEIYNNIANEIVEVSITRQTAEVTGAIQTILYPNSYIEFVYTPSIPQRGYSEIVLPFESQPFSSCEDATFIPPNFTIESARATSYSGDYWSDNVSIRNSNTSNNWMRVFNLSQYGWNYFVLGDPFNVRFDPSRIKAGELNYFHVGTGPNPFERNPNCSASNKLIYDSRISASVPYDEVFPQISGGNYTVFYDLDADSIPDGNTSVAIGTNLPGFDPTPKTIDQLDVASNAFDDALLRFLTRLNYYTQVSDSGRPGSSTNPIDVKLGAEVYSEYASTPEIPFMWGPAEIKISIWR